MCVTIPYTDPNLLNTSEENVAASPFTLVLERAGLAAAASVINSVVLTSVLSAGNSTVYIGSRLLYSMAQSGKAPKAFAHVSKSGVPVLGVLVTLAVANLAFLSSFVGDSIVYTWLYNATGLSGFIVWAATCAAQLRFRAAWKARGRLPSELPYRARLFPIGTWFALIVFVMVIIGQGASLVLDGFSWQGLMVAYIGLPLAIALYLGYKMARKTSIRPLTTVDLSASDVTIDAFEDEPHLHNA